MYIGRRIAALAAGSALALALPGPAAIAAPGADPAPGRVSADQARQSYLRNFPEEIAALSRTVEPRGDASGLTMPDEESGRVLTHVPRQASGELRLAAGRVRAAIASGDQAGGVAVDVPGGLLFANTDASTDTVVLPLSEAVTEVFNVLRGPEAPTTIRTRLTLEPGHRLVQGEQNTAGVVDSKGRPLVIIAAPWAVDAAGAAVPLELSVQGGSLLVSVGHRGRPTQYPVLVDPSYWYLDGINSAELGHCWWPSRWAICTRVQGHADAALADAQRYYPTSLHNGRGDAFRHCYWSGRMTVNDGATEAKGFGDRHEEWSGNPWIEKEMDLRNNSIGRYVGGWKGNYGYNYSVVRDKCRYRADNAWLWWIVNGQLV